MPSLRKPLLQVRRSRADSIAHLRASLAFRCADGVCRAQCIAPAKRSRADVFEKRKAILIAVYNKDAAERKRRIGTKHCLGVNPSGYPIPIGDARPSVRERTP